MITDANYNELVDMLKQNDLELKCSAPHQAATGNDRIDNNPEVIFCRWKRDGILISSIEMTKQDLSYLIRKLQDDGLTVPIAFSDFTGTE